jgi:hypothetical protein
LGFGTLESEFIENMIDEIAREYGTRDIYQIAGKAGVSIIYESWYPVTLGEFEKKTKTIRVNRNAPGKSEDAENTQRKIVAHELAHFFAIDLKMDKKEEEKFARSFTEKLLENDR